MGMKFHKFHLEADATGLPPDFCVELNKIVASESSTPIERLLAMHLVRLADSYRDLVHALGNGTVTAYVPESGVEIVDDDDFDGRQSK